MRLLPWSTSLHVKLVLALAVLVALVAAGAAWMAFERERERRLQELEGRATRIADLFSRSVAYPLWNVDRQAIDGQLAALAPNPEVAVFEVTAVGYGKVSSVVKQPEATLRSPVVRVRPILYAATAGADGRVDAADLGQRRELQARRLGDSERVLERGARGELDAERREAVVAGRRERRR